MNVELTVYIDSSALVKLVLSEPGSPALRRYLSSRRSRASSALAQVEVIRAVRLRSVISTRTPQAVLDNLQLIAVDQGVLQTAAMLEPLSLRSLDAIHLASALSLGPNLAALVTYDRRMEEAARLLDIPVDSPA